mgnify:FL=1|tara:strand:+ start:667 stop:822 length:156 start_codon:yes stop_codon:yes gene_type:complete
MKKVKVKNGKHYVYGELLEENEHKFIIVQKGGAIEMHFPKKDYKYILVEDK